MKKFLKKMKNNQGNSFIVVIATLSFLSVLVSAILVAVALCYRLKAYDINSRDNFYYLEQAMDEIYAGLGADSLGYLSEAYNDTLEVMVYFDPSSKSYKTMTQEEANAVFATTFVDIIHSDSRYESSDDAQQRLLEFISNPYDADENPEGVSITVGRVDNNRSDGRVLYSVVLRREATYSTVNTRSQKNTKGTNKTVGAPDTFIQTITADLVVTKPSVDIEFKKLANSQSEVFEYIMVADMGIEITGKDGKPAIGDKVSLSGNLYAASDFYNKSYNENPDDVTLVSGAAADIPEKMIQKVNSYDDDRLKECDGVSLKSMYSGIYVDGAQLVVNSDRLVVPGTIAAMNCADVAITTVSNSSAEGDFTDLWVDGIVLDGYSLKQNVEGTESKGASLTMRAKAYVYDDLEVNANSSSVLLNGEYYGYNFASTDNRTYSKDALKNGTRKFTKNTDKKYTDGKEIEGQAHYNSSAIIMNGEDTSLDFSLVKALYVAGQSYIELSKDTKMSKDAEEVTYTVKGESSSEVLTDEVKTKSYDYAETKKTGDDATYTTSSADDTKTAVQDYRTGEAISVKSNQLAYVPPTSVIDDEEKGELYFKLPPSLKKATFGKDDDGNDIVNPYSEIWKDLDKVPVIKTVIAGKKYYFLDFANANVDDPKAMNQFIEEYTKLFAEGTISDASDLTVGQSLNLTNIADYDYFKVKMLKVATDADGEYNNIYTNSAITTRVGDSFTIKASSDNKTALLKAATNINNAITGAMNGQTLVNTGGAASVLASNVTNKLNLQYKENKFLLTNASSNAEDIAIAHALTDDYITPINRYFDFSNIKKNEGVYNKLACGYVVWIADGDIEISANDSPSFSNGRVRGLVLATGDVTFADNVENFEGLIVTGGKIIINNFGGSKNSMNLSSNEEIIKTILRECESTRGESKAKNFSFVCDMFNEFKVTKDEEETGEDVTSLSFGTRVKDISAIQIEDVLAISNWRKNVD